MSEPKIVRKYEHSRLEETFESYLKKTYSVSEPQVGIIRSFLTDLDNDGANNDIAGTAILKIGRSFKSFIYLMKNDGAIRFLESNGYGFDPDKGRSTLSCSNKPIACPDTMERARQQIHGSAFSVFEYDKEQAGLEIVIPYKDGSYGILNSLSIFAN